MICGLGGKPLDVIGETELLITDAGPVNVMVTRGLPHQLLLGSDAIAAGHGVLDYENMRLQWYGQRYVLYGYPDYAPNAEAVYVRQASGFEAIDVVIEEYQDIFGKGNGADSFGYYGLIPLTVGTGDARPTRA